MSKERRDFYTGLQWVNITPEQARALPKGKLNAVLWAIAAYFILIALYKFWWVLDVGGGLGIAVLNSIWPLLAGIGLALRVPWSVIMAIISTGLTVWALMRGLGTDTGVAILLETVANVGILFYLMDGDRPNLIYRHRYRRYSAQEGGDGDAD